MLFEVLHFGRLYALFKLHSILLSFPFSLFSLCSFPLYLIHLFFTLGDPHCYVILDHLTHCFLFFYFSVYIFSVNLVYLTFTFSIAPLWYFYFNLKLFE